MDKLTAYKILSINDNATEDDIKNAYKELARKYDLANYESGPLREEAELKMNEINEAFDVAISISRGHSDINGQPVQNNPVGEQTENETESPKPHWPHAQAPHNPYATGTGEKAVGKYPEIRQLISIGKLDEAMAELTAILGGANDAEWNFLMGSIYYYKGWLDQAVYYFKVAVKLDPNNKEYEAALNNLHNNAQGDMPGNPFTTENPGAAAVNCACRTCTLLCCFDMCCSMCRGC